MKKIVNTHLISGRGYFINRDDDEFHELVKHIIVYIFDDGCISYRPIASLVAEDPISDSSLYYDDEDASEVIDFIQKGYIIKTISRFGRIVIDSKGFTDVEEAISVFKSHGIHIV